MKVTRLTKKNVNILRVNIKINKESRIPDYLQLINQIKEGASSNEQEINTLIKDIDNASVVLDLERSVVLKALRQLEFQGILYRETDLTFVVNSQAESSRYSARGVSSDKTEVLQTIASLDKGLYPNAFCKISEDFLSGREDYCNLIHSDGAGTKSIVAYLQYKESGDPKVFRGIAQDSIVMNLDDLICSGARSSILISTTINRNAMNCPQEVIRELILGTEDFLESMRTLGINIRSGGGETADVGDLTGTIIVDSCASTILKRQDVIKNEISEDLTILGFSSTGKSTYETAANSGVGSNGLTSARHELLSKFYRGKYPETADLSIDPDLSYCGKWRLDDQLPGTPMTIGSALLSPTRTYAPLIAALSNEFKAEIKGLVHCSGGGQTKCLRFGKNIHFVKDQLFEVPPLFETIRTASNTSWHEMYKTFNMGHRMELYINARHTDSVISLAKSFNIEARIIGFTERAKSNCLTLTKGNQKLFYES